MKKFTGSKSSEEASYVKLSQKYEPEESNQQIEEIKSDYCSHSAPCYFLQVGKETLVRNQVNFVSGSLLQLVQVHINTDVFHLKSLMNFSILPIKPEEPVDWDSKIVRAQTNIVS